MVSIFRLKLNRSTEIKAVPLVLINTVLIILFIFEVCQFRRYQNR